MRSAAHDAPGHFVRLSDGLCHYRLDGRRDGPPVLLIHGATVPGWEFDRFVPLLEAAGYRCVRPDLYGHGHSDRPRARYSHALFVRQLREFIATLALDRPMILIGHSLGAALAARLVAADPQRYAAMVLCARWSITSPMSPPPACSPGRCFENASCTVRRAHVEAAQTAEVRAN